MSRHECDVVVLVARKHRYDAAGYVGRISNWIFYSKRVEVSHSFNRGVCKIDEETQCENAEEPLSSRHEVVFVARVLIHLIRKKE